MSTPLSNKQLNQIVTPFQGQPRDDFKVAKRNTPPLEEIENKGALISSKQAKRPRRNALVLVNEKIARVGPQALISKNKDLKNQDLDFDAEVAGLFNDKAAPGDQSEQRDLISKTPGCELAIVIKSRAFDLNNIQHAQIIHGLQNYSGSPFQGMPREAVIDASNKILEFSFDVLNGTLGTDKFVRHSLSLGNKEVNLKVNVTHPEQNPKLNITVRSKKQPKFGGALKIFHKAVIASINSDSVQVINAADLTTKATLGTMGCHLLKYEERILSFINKMLLEKKREDLEFPKIHELTFYRSQKGQIKARVVMGLFHFGDLFDVISKKICPPNSPLQNDPIKMWKENDQWALKLAISIAESVAFLHEIGLVHLDLKPENILMRGNEGDEMKPKAMVGDFDTARFYEKPGYHRRSVGTINFMSPQQLKYNSTDQIQPEDEDHLKPPADVWSLGVVYFAMASNKYPLWGSLARLYCSLFDTGRMIKQSVLKKAENRTPLNIHNEMRLKKFNELLLNNVDPKEYATLFTASQFNDKNSVPFKLVSKENAYMDELNTILLSIRQSLSEGVDEQVVTEFLHVMKMVGEKLKMVYKHLREAEAYSDPILNLIQKMLQPDIDKRMTIEEVVLSLKALL